MTGIAAKTSAMFNNGVTTVEIIDSDNDDIGIGNRRGGIRNIWVPSMNTIWQVFTSSSASVSSNNKRFWRRRQDKKDASKNEQYYQQDDEQDDYHDDNQDVHQQIDEINGSKCRDIEDDENDDEEREIRKKMLRKPNKKETEVKKQSK